MTIHINTKDMKKSDITIIADDCRVDKRGGLKITTREGYKITLFGMKRMLENLENYDLSNLC